VQLESARTQDANQRCTVYKIRQCAFYQEFRSQIHLATGVRFHSWHCHSVVLTREIGRKRERLGEREGESVKEQDTERQQASERVCECESERVSATTRNRQHEGVRDQTARKTSWNNMGVEPGNQEGPSCWDLGRVLVRIKSTRFVRDNGTNQTKKGYRVEKPVSKKLLVRRKIATYRIRSVRISLSEVYQSKKICAKKPISPEKQAYIIFLSLMICLNMPSKDLLSSEFYHSKIICEKIPISSEKKTMKSCFLPWYIWTCSCRIFSPTKPTFELSSQERPIMWGSFRKKAL